jgi:REP element-mobilizing transposase RayT
MTRPLRINFEGALYHVTARGNNKETIFLDERDYKKYFHFLERYKMRFDFRLHAYALMPNHVHLLLETGKDPVSKIMQAIHTSYTMYFNTRHGRVGHVFQGRFKSLLCDRDAYLLELVRYIHLNPVRAGLAKNLKDYPWSSHKEYLGTKQLVDTEMVLEMLGGISAYKDFVRGGLKNIDSLTFPEIKDQIFIGDLLFIETARAQSAPIKSFAKQPSKTRPEQIISEVAHFFNLSPKEILGERKTREISLARNAAIYFIRVYCKAGLEEVARLFSFGTPTICHSVARIEKKMEDPVFKKLMITLEDKFKKLEQ